MEPKGLNEKEVSEQNKEALQSETWQEARKVMKTEVQHFTEAPEIQHFVTEKVSKNDNVYGIAWGNVVREYLKTAYSGENAQADVISDGIAYKVLKREEVTAFYDAAGNTLFDVANGRLEKEYGYVMEEEKSGNGTPDEGVASPDPAAIKQKAKEKLEKEMKDDRDKAFAEPVIRYLLKRCEEDEGLAEDVVQEHKTWKKCVDYIYGQARKQATGNRAVVRNDVVYEWAEDYYRKDDKAEEEKKAREAAERKRKQQERPAKAKPEPNKAENPKPKEAPKPKRNSKDMDGQLDMFSMMGM